MTDNSDRPMQTKMKNAGNTMTRRSPIDAIKWLFVSLVLLSVNSFANNDNLTSIVDRTVISINESVVLTVRYTGERQQAAPSFAQLETQFHIRSRQQSNQYSVVNGQVSSYTDWTLVLDPKSEGKLIIPSFRLGSLISDAVEVTVTPEKQLPAGKIKEVFLDTVVEKEQVFVQEQLIVRYRLFFSRNVNSVEAQPLVIPNVVVDALPEKQFNHRINGQLYRVAEYSYALFPQESGEFEIPSLAWTISVPTTNSRSFLGFSGRNKAIRQRTKSHTIKVLPQPDTFPPQHTWLPAQNVSLEETWSSDPNQMIVGEPMTRTLTLKVEGLTSAQLPDIWKTKSTGIMKIYGDKPELSDEKLDQGFTAIRKESSAVVVNSAGSVTLPAIKIPWWDSNSNTLQWAAVPERTISVQGGVNNGMINGSPQVTASSAPNAVQSNAQTSALTESLNEEVLTLKSKLRSANIQKYVLLLLFLIALALLIREKILKPSSHSTTNPNTGKQESSTAKKAFSQLLTKCQQGSAHDIRTAVFAWATAYWPDQKPKTLDDIAQLIDDTEITQALKTLDASLYADDAHSGSQNVDGNKLAALLKTFISKRRGKEQNSKLEGLYGK